MSTESLTCGYCGHSFPNSRTSCPHCARPQLFPNVSKAASATQKAKLDQRFDESRSRCESDGKSDEFDRFHQVAGSTHALFACPIEKLHRQIASGTDVFETYYQLEELRLRATAPKDLDWEKLRPQAEIELLGSHHNIEKLHYACLSLDWQSLTSYGDCVVRLNDSMIGHRASCFEGNSAVIYWISGNFDDCLRSSWDDRGKLAVAVFSKRLSERMPNTEFPNILVAVGTNPIDDEFIEVHVFGTMTVRTFAEVKFLASCAGRRESVYREAIVEKLDQAKVRHSV